ncbi:MAG: OmpA family protein [Gammaproteobacteria bacterium]|nr:OmpA family protein [Gammaproteobacteria bacterium]
MKTNTPITTVAAASVLLAAIQAPQAQAAEAAEEPRAQPREVVLGTGAGALVGAILAGPPGLIVGAIGGNYIGRGVTLEKELDSAQQELGAAQRELSQVRGDLSRQRRLADERREARAIQVASAQPIGLEGPADVPEAVRKGFTFTVQFRTDSDVVEPHFRSQLVRLARGLGELEDTRVRLQGFADRRGTQGHNLELSRRRVASVRGVLVANGVEPDRIREAAHGEARPLFEQGDREGHDFERRVLITFEQ